jgi:multidrug efflux pump subunit AcrB
VASDATSVNSARAALAAVQTHFRPIIMTTVATPAGMLPHALGLEPGSASRASLK